MLSDKLKEKVEYMRPPNMPDEEFYSMVEDNIKTIMKLKEKYPELIQLYGDKFPDFLERALYYYAEQQSKGKIRRFFDRVKSGSWP